MIRHRVPPLALLVALSIAAVAPLAVAADDAPLPRGPGLSADHPGDRGLGDDPAVLVFEPFDAAALAEVQARWDEASNRDGRVLALRDDAPEGAGDRRCLEMAAHPGLDTGGHLYRRLPREVDELFVRFYVKFPEPANYVHHFVHVGGYRPATRYPQGGAGERPRGDERVTVGIEPFGRNGTLPAPGDWNLYAYWHEMKRSADGRYWGNGLSPARPQRVPAGRWQCVELQFRLNTPGRRDGALALWLDGEPVADFRAGAARDAWTGLGFQLRDDGKDGEPFEGFDFRTTADLRLNFLWLMHYVTPENQRRNRVADPDRPSVVRFDQVVAATRYVGPIVRP
jgi:hypothetical protein